MEPESAREVRETNQLAVGAVVFLLCDDLCALVLWTDV
jgi:hypothetical protein